MKKVGRLVFIVLMVCVVSIVWYARWGESFTIRQTYSNASDAPEGARWVSSDAGLYGGPVTAIAVDPDRQSSLYAATREDEVYLSVDSGQRWSDTGGPSSNHYVTGISIMAGTNGRVIGKAVYGVGFLQSQDGGETWSDTSRGLASKSVTCLSADPTRADTLYAGTGDAGLFASTNGGRSWAAVGVGIPAPRITAVTVSPDGRTVYAGTQLSGLFASQDGGRSWKVLTSTIPLYSSITGVSIDPQDPQVLLLSAMGGGAGVSMDGGMTWLVSTRGSLPSDCSSALVLHDTERRFIIGTQSGALYWSSDARTWQLAGQLPDESRIFALTRVLSGALAATSHGVYRSADGTAWQESTAGITNLLIADLAASQLDSLFMAAATDDGVYITNDGGMSWARSSPRGHILSVLISASDANTVLAGTDKGTVVHTRDGGRSWQTASSGLPGMAVHDLVQLDGTGADVYACTDDGVAVSHDLGASWSAFNRGLVKAAAPGQARARVETAAMVFDPSYGGRLVLAVTGQGLYVSPAAVDTWQALPPPLGTPWVTTLAVDAQSKELLVGTSSDGLAVSGNGGTSWERRDTGMRGLLVVPGAITCLAVTAHERWAGTSLRGAFRSADGGEHWVRINAGVPDLDIRQVIVVSSRVFLTTRHHISVLKLSTSP
jgi:photosystem II stability/assembly factor-like uncharacterized protein